MNGWSNFFVGELSASAALAGLLFVSVSVNHARILELGRTADRGIEALAMLFLVLVIASLALIPGQPLRWLGGEILVISLGTLIALIPLQHGYLRELEPVVRRRSVQQIRANRLAVGLIVLAGLVLVWRGDGAAIYCLPPGILLTFIAVAINAWVLLIEINR